MSISIGNISSLPHQVLQILPANPGAEVLHHDPVVCPGGGTILVQPWSSGISSSVSSSVPVTGPITSSSSSMLHRHPFSQNLLSIEFIDSIISIPMIIKLHKSKSLLDQDVRLPAIAFEELFKIPLSGSRGQVPYIDPAPTPRHLKTLILL